MDKELLHYILSKLLVEVNQILESRAFHLHVCRITTCRPTRRYLFPSLELKWIFPPLTTTIACELMPSFK